MNRYLSTGLIIGVLSLLSYAGISQPGLYTEDAIQDQDKFLKAKNLVLMGKLDQAEEIYLSLSKSNKRNDVVMYELSRLYHNKEDGENASRYIKKAIQINPSNQWYHRLQGSYLEKEELYDQALKCYSKLIELDPQNLSFLSKHAQLATKALDDQTAIASYNRIEAITGISEKISKKKFKIQSRMGETDAAVNELNRLVTAFPQTVRYRNNMASYLLEIGKEKEALASYAEVLRIDPEDPIALIAISAKNASDQPDSNRSLSSAISQIISNPAINIDKKIAELLPMVTDLENMGDVQQQEVMGLIDQLSEIHPDDAKSHAIYGDALLAVGDEPKAIAEYQKAISITKNVFPIWEQLLYAQESQKLYEDLQQTAEEALDYYPNQPLCYYFMGTATARIIQPQLSKEELFLRGIKEGDHNKAAKAAYEESVSYLEEALLMTGNNESLQYRILRSLAFISHDYKRSEKAETYALQALEKQGNIKDPELENLIQSIDQLNKN